MDTQEKSQTNDEYVWLTRAYISVGGTLFQPRSAPYKKSELPAALLARPSFYTTTPPGYKTEVVPNTITVDKLANPNTQETKKELSIKVPTPELLEDGILKEPVTNFIEKKETSTSLPNLLDMSKESIEGLPYINRRLAERVFYLIQNTPREEITFDVLNERCKLPFGKKWENQPISLD